MVKHGYHSKEGLEKRRKIMADLMFKRGIGSPTELQRVLESEFGICIQRNTVYQDIKALSGLRFDDEMRSFDSFILAKMRANYIQLEDLAKRAMDAGNIRVEADVRKKLSSVAKEFHEVNHRIFEADKRSSPKRDGEAPTKFTFGDPKVVTGKQCNVCKTHPCICEGMKLEKPSGKTDKDEDVDGGCSV